MSRSVDILTESPATVEQVHAALSREDYWLARHAIFDASSRLDSFTTDADGTVTVRATQHLGRRLLPDVVASLLPGDLKIRHDETWKPAGDGRVRGQVNVSAPAGLGSGRADAWLTPAGNGSRLQFAATVQVKIPLLASRLEKSIGADLVENIAAIHRFTTAWIAEHA